jgi:hypothetical protein
VFEVPYPKYVKSARSKWIGCAFFPYGRNGQAIQLDSLRIQIGRDRKRRGDMIYGFERNTINMNTSLPCSYLENFNSSPQSPIYYFVTWENNHMLARCHVDVFDASQDSFRSFIQSSPSKPPHPPPPDTQIGSVPNKYST